MDELDKRFLSETEALGLRRTIDSAERIIIAYSGGADSSLLLYLLSRYLKDRPQTLEAAHLNHMIRGADADRDENFCRESADALGIKLHVRRVDIPSLAKSGGSVEEVARRERYAFFDELCAQGGRTLTATAHNADDNLETVIFNLVRGAGARGMCGIPPIRDGRYIRPLLTFSGKEIRKICDEHGIKYVTDLTNFETDYTRNHIRRNIVPELEKITPFPQLSVRRMTSSLRLDCEYIDCAVEEVPLSADMCSMKRENAEGLHAAILFRVLQKMYGAATKNNAGRPSLEAVHVKDIEKCLSRRSGDFEISVPGGVRFYARGDTVGFEHINKSVQTKVFQSEYVFDIGKLESEGACEADTALGKIILTLNYGTDASIPEYNENIYNLSIHKVVSFDKIKGKLILRTRRDGDIIVFGGMSRRVKKLFSERKIPPEKRGLIPILSDDRGILWIYGFPMRDGISAQHGERGIHIFVLDKKCGS